jgi:hypothetical protein
MKPLETAMHKKRAEQTKNVKKLTTSDDAYSPERRMIKIEKRTPSGGTGIVRHTTDWSNLKDETSKAKKYFTEKVGSPTSVQVLGPKDFDKRRRKLGSTREKKWKKQLVKEPGVMGAKRKKILIDKSKANKLKRLPRFGGGRTNLLEELGRVEGEHSNRNRRAEVSRIHGELNRGYRKGGIAKKIRIRNKASKKAFKIAKGKAAGGRIGLKHGSSAQSHYLQHGYGPTKTRLRTGKPKIAIKGWS